MMSASLASAYRRDLSERYSIIVSAKQADVELQALQIRIAKLRNEEVKARHRIDAARRRSKEIQGMKQAYSVKVRRKRNELIETAISQREAARETYEAQKREREEFHKREEEKLRKKQEEAKKLKAELQTYQTALEEEKTRQAQAARAQKEVARKQEQEATEAMRKTKEEREAQRRLEEEARLAEIERKRQQKLADTGRMEQVERSLLERLRLAQQEQRKAYEELENALRK